MVARIPQNPYARQRNSVCRERRRPIALARRPVQPHHSPELQLGDADLHAVRARRQLDREPIARSGRTAVALVRSCGPSSWWRVAGLASLAGPACEVSARLPRNPNRDSWNRGSPGYNEDETEGDRQRGGESQRTGSTQRAAGRW